MALKIKVVTGEIFTATHYRNSRLIDKTDIENQWKTFAGLRTEDLAMHYHIFYNSNCPSIIWTQENKYILANHILPFELE